MQQHPTDDAITLAQLSANEMRRRDVQYGLVSICAQGGMGYAMVLERDR